MERRQRWHSGFKSKASAERSQRVFLTGIEQGTDPFPETMTVREYAESWLTTKATQVRAGTIRRYRQLINTHALPVIGSYRLERVKPAQIQAVLDGMRAKDLAPATIIQARAALGAMFGTALSGGLILSNPVSAVKRPRIDRTGSVALTAEQLSNLISAAKGTTWEIPILLAATTAARRGEVLGLRWADVDLGESRVRIVRSLQRAEHGLTFEEPKTDRSRREFAVPEFVAGRLRHHREAQAERCLALGSAWVNEGLVCDRGDGGPLDPDAFSKAFKRIAEKAGLPDTVHLHDARHGIATKLMAANVNPGIVSALLGHAAPGFTLAVYSHVTPSMTEIAADVLNAALRDS